MDFTGKKVLVTGSSRGIGAETAKAFARYGAQVAVHYHSDEEKARATLNALAGDNHILVKGDIQDPDMVEAIIDGVAAHYGGLDIVVNNAGVYIPHDIFEVDYAAWRAAWTKTLQVNLVACANIFYHSAKHMRKQGGGRIVCVSSRGAYRGEPGHPAYGASKAGLNSLSQSMAARLGPYGIFVGTVAPGFVMTDMTRAMLEGDAGDAIRNQSPLGRVAEPAEIAKAILFLSEEGTEFATGTVLDINGASYFH